MVQGAYDSEDLIDSCTLTPEDHVRIAGKSRDNRLAFAVLLLFFRANGRFPDVAEIHPPCCNRLTLKVKSTKRLNSHHQRLRLSTCYAMIPPEPASKAVIRKSPGSIPSVDSSCLMFH